MMNGPEQAWNDLDLVLISALEHYSYCPRQCALIHLEQTFDENIYTIKGDMLHERVDEEASELRGDVRIERAVPLWSRRLGLVGGPMWWNSTASSLSLLSTRPVLAVSGATMIYNSALRRCAWRK